MIWKKNKNIFDDNYSNEPISEIVRIFFTILLLGGALLLIITLMFPKEKENDLSQEEIQQIKAESGLNFR